MRSEFEKTRTFKSIYSTLMYFDEDLDLYISKEKWREEDAWRLTYAWWAYKELQTKIDSKNETTKEGFALWFKTTSYFGAYFTDLDLTLNHRNQFENDIINSAWLAYQSRQTEVDKLTLQVAEMKSRLNDAYTDGQSAMYTSRQSKVDELQKRVDAVKQLIEEYRDPPTEDKTFCHALSIVAYELEQALKGGEDASN